MISWHHIELPGHMWSYRKTVQSQPAFCCLAIEHSENVFLVVESVINISWRKRESLSASWVQCGVNAMCFREQSVSTVQTHCWNRAKEHTCSFYTGVQGLVFPLSGLGWAHLNISRAFPDNPVVRHEALLASQYTLYEAGL